MEVPPTLMIAMVNVNADGLSDPWCCILLRTSRILGCTLVFWVRQTEWTLFSSVKRFLWSDFMYISWMNIIFRTSVLIQRMTSTDNANRFLEDNLAVTSLILKWRIQHLYYVYFSNMNHHFHICSQLYRFSWICLPASSSRPKLTMKVVIPGLRIWLCCHLSSIAVFGLILKLI
jgi:hypothetical protein